jgi:hypothetical protein
MSWRKFDTVYVNGCSHTAGGGLYDDGTKELYKEIYNLSWKTEREVNYPKLLSKYFDCNLVDDSRCGSGAPRLVRKTFEYIFNVGLEKAKKTLFIFQINTPVHRLEYYCSKIDDYLIVNVQYEDDGSFKYVTAVDSHSKNEWTNNPKFYEGEITENIKKQLTDYHNPLAYLDKIHNEVVGLFSYLEHHNIEYFFGFDTGNIMKPVNEKRRIDIEGDQTIIEYCSRKKLRICDETSNRSIDGHPGYFGNKEYADKLIEFLEEKLKPTIWVFGDSYSTTSIPPYTEGHHLYENDFRVKYSKFKGYYPKHYPEIVAENFKCNLINLALPSTTNDQIHQSYVDNIDKIKPNDILIFGWTYVSRYNLANRKNELENISIDREGEITFVDFLSSQSINEVLYNRGSHTVFYKWVISYIKSINATFKDNVVLHYDFFPHGNVDEYVEEYFKLLSPRKLKYETICEDMGEGNDIHYSEKGHLDFSNDVSKLLMQRMTLFNKEIITLI